MADNRRRTDRRDLPSLDVYEREFRVKFGREMTPDERRFYDLTRELLKDFDDQDGNDKADGEVA